jgi:hypothetical protein
MLNGVSLIVIFMQGFRADLSRGLFGLFLHASQLLMVLHI